MRDTGSTPGGEVAGLKATDAANRHEGNCVSITACKQLQPLSSCWQQSPPDGVDGAVPSCCAQCAGWVSAGADA
jgi:hypothetical protein